MMPTTLHESRPTTKHRYTAANHMPSAAAASLVTKAGADNGTRDHHDVLELRTATTVTSGTPASISVYQPWDHAATKDATKHHPLAVWESLSVTINGAAGVYGRAITLYTGWGHDGEDAPTTLSHMAALHDFRISVLGGAADPGGELATSRPNFNVGPSDVLKVRNHELGGRCVFYYCFKEANFGSVQVDDDRVILTFHGRYRVYGRSE